MRVRVDYRTRYTYAQPAHGIVQLLRLTPADTHSQHADEWRIDIDIDGALKPFTDAFGNRAHMFYAGGAADAMTLHVTGEVQMEDAAGIVRGAPEPLPPTVFLRATERTAADPTIAALARETAGSDAVAALHRLMGLIHARIAFVPGATDSATPAAQVLRLGQGVCQDHAHLFIAAARAMGVPARYVSGHLVRADGAVDQPAGHAWAEAWVADLGWVAFDPANGIGTTDHYIRVAVGLDYLDAAPVRGARRGGGTETMDVHVRADRASQWQSQSMGSMTQSQSMGDA